MAFSLNLNRRAPGLALSITAGQMLTAPVYLLNYGIAENCRCRQLDWTLPSFSHAGVLNLILICIHWGLTSCSAAELQRA